MNLAGYILGKAGWRFEVNLPLPPQCLICVAPHTSNWDFIVGELGIRSVGMKAGFLMKSTWFFFPLGSLLRAIGGIPVHRSSKAQAKLEQKGISLEPLEKINGVDRHHVTQNLVKEFARHKTLAVAVTPEGTRSINPHWHKGVLVIAQQAQVPIILAYFDYKRKVACLDRTFTPIGDMEADMLAIKRYYQDHGHAKFPEKFTTGLEL